MKLIEYSYNAYGLYHIAQYNNGYNTKAADNPFTYRGYYMDVDLGFFYLGSRYYDFKTCRFVNVDSYVSTGQGLLGCNMFCYCNNNPVSNVDLNGKLAFSILALVTFSTAAVGGMLSLVLFDGVTKEDEYNDALIYAQENENAEFLYVDSKVDSVKDSTFKIEASVGLYQEKSNNNEYNSIEIDGIKAEAIIGYSEISMGAYLVEVVGKNSAFYIGKKRIEVGFGINYGVGAGIGIGKKNIIGVSLGVGFVFSIEVIE